MSELRSIEQAKALLDAICLRIDGSPASAKTIAKEPFTEAASKEWWLHLDDIADPSRNRTVALLTSYVELGGESFPLTGIPLSDGYLRPDRKVMRSLYRAGRVDIRNGFFVLTDEGRRIVKEKHQPAAETVALDAGTENEPQFGRGGEGENHKRLRLWVLENIPALFPKLTAVEAVTEYQLPSADRIDVACFSPTLRLAVEVKSQDSNEADLARGIYQCVKYRAVLRAITPDEAIKVQAVLVSQVALPPHLNEEARRLDIPSIVVPPARIT